MPGQISSIIEAHRPALDPYEALYKHFHQNPELSFFEKRTASDIHSHLQSLSSDLTHRTSIGGHGLCAILNNGSGPTVLLRADMDALPVAELTGLAYASSVKMTDHEGVEQPVMHACGHDMHITTLLAAAELLISARAQWSGTLIFCFQPAEEKGAGAQAMVDDGLYTKHGVPQPDVVLGGHVWPSPAGTLGTRAGMIATAADSFKITLSGVGGHASTPHQTIDPVIMAAYTIARLQTVVSRETDPSTPAVVSVSAVRAGTTENVIAAEAQMKVNVRTYTAESRRPTLDAVRRIVDSESLASNAPREPRFDPISSFPLTMNDGEVTAKVSGAWAEHFGDAFDGSCAPMSASEDFGILASAIGKPSCFWLYGGTDPELYARKKEEGKLKELHYNHSPFFAPVVHPTLQSGIDAYAVAALAWLVKK